MKRFFVVILFFASWYFVSSLISNDMVERGTNVHGPIIEKSLPVPTYAPNDFNVLVVSHRQNIHAYEAEAVPYFKVSEICQKTPNWSFLIPAHQEEQLNRQLARSARKINELNSVHYAIAGFRVTQLAKGRQRIVLRSGDGIDRACYIADSRSIKPISFSVYVGKRDMIYVVGWMIGTVANGMLWLLGWILLKTVNWPKALATTKRIAILLRKGGKCTAAAPSDD